MKHVVLALPVVAVLTAVALPGAPGHSAEPGVCDQMTPSRMLENPGLAHAYAQALRSGDAGEVQRVVAMLREIRAAHGCDGETPSATAIRLRSSAKWPAAVARRASSTALKPATNSSSRRP